MNASVANQEVAGTSGEPPNERVFYFCGQPIKESPNGTDSESEDLVRIYQIVESLSVSEESSEKKGKSASNDSGDVSGDDHNHENSTKYTEIINSKKLSESGPDTESWMPKFLRDAVNLFWKFLTNAVDQFSKVIPSIEGAVNSATDGKSEQFSKNTQISANFQNPKEKRVTQSTFQAIDSSKAILIEDLIIKPIEVLPLGKLRVLQSADKINSSLVEMRSTGECGFELVYTRAPIDKVKLKDKPDLLALIARAFLMAKISVYKRRLRLVLVEMNENLAKLDLSAEKIVEDFDKLVNMYGQIGEHKASISFLLKCWWRLENKFVLWRERVLEKSHSAGKKEEKECWWCLENKFVLWKERVLKKRHPAKKEEQSLGLVISQAIPALWLGVLLVLTYLWLAIPIIQQWQGELFFVYCWLSLASLLAVVALLSRKLIQSAFGVASYCRIYWVLIVGLMIIILPFFLKSPIDPHSTVATLAGCGHLIILTGVVLAFLGVSLNLRTMEDRVGEKIEETTADELDKILSGLTQSNASVAALNTLPATEVCVPELLLREFDEKFRTKDAISSLEKVILARKRDLTMRISHIKEHQQRARRAATAAAGGVFTGFFTFEVGESVFKYHHFQHGTDDRSMFFWFSAEAGHFGNPDLKNENKVKPKEVTDYFNACKEKHGAMHSACMEIKKELTESHNGKFDAYFKQQYHNPELVTYGILLIITLTVSLLAALIGWRKPAEEQGGGHGKHH